jgi:uncharacterized damage-inducible protein DinB
MTLGEEDDKVTPCHPPLPQSSTRSITMALSDLLASYHAGSGQLHHAVVGLTREQLRERPIPGKWSILEVVCHLADFEPIQADRMKRVVAEERPTLIGADENRYAATLAYHDRDLHEELAIIENTRAQLVRILRTQPESVLQRVGVHNERGPLTLEKLLQITTNHIPHHVQFILEKRKAMGVAGAA